MPPENASADGPGFVFTHIPKTGGSNFAGALKSVVGLAACSSIFCAHDAMSCWFTEHAIAHRRAHACNLAAAEGFLRDNLAAAATLWPSRPIRSVLLLRRPQAHVLSLYAHCQQPKAEGFIFHGYARIGLAEWLLGAAERNATEVARFCSYSPVNHQVARLSGSGAPEGVEATNSASALGRAVRALDGAWFVGVSDWFDASVCALARRLDRELPGTGGGAVACASSSAERLTHGTRTSQLVIDGQVRAAIDRITRDDAVVHAHAVVRLEQDVREQGGELRRLRSGRARRR